MFNIFSNYCILLLLEKKKKKLYVQFRTRQRVLHSNIFFPTMSSKIAAFAIAETSRRRVNSARLVVDLVSLNRNNQHSLNNLYSVSRCSTLQECIISIQKRNGRDNKLKIVKIGYVGRYVMFDYLIYKIIIYQQQKIEILSCIVEHYK